MLVPTAAMAALTLALFATGWWRGDGAHLRGVQNGMTFMLKVLPLLFFAAMTTGLVEALIPKDVFAQWVGPASGIRGILIATLVGGIAPGGPIVQAGIAGGLLHAGAGLGPVVAFLVAGEMWGLTLMPMEVTLLGWRVYLVRLACTFYVPPLAGLLTHFIFSGTTTPR